MTSTHIRLAIPRILFRVLVVAAGLACRSDSIVALDAGDRDRHISAHVGDRIDVTLQSIGGGEYSPALSSSAIAFLNVEYCGTVPAGVTQCFHFRAVSPGQVLLTFTHSGMNPTVHDTVEVH